MHHLIFRKINRIRFLNAYFALILVIISSQTALGDQNIYTCNFIQVCDDIGNGCALSALRLNVDRSIVLFEHETETENRQMLLEVTGLEGLVLLTVSPEGRAKLSEHRQVETANGRAISYHGVCDN
jgi:hypothetical protein